MNFINQTLIKGFILHGISDIPELHVFTFFLILFIYLLGLAGNLAIVLLVCLDVHLHTPMYFFLSNLSIIDMSSSTTALHRIFIAFATQNKIVSPKACMAELYIFCSLTSNELSILAAMSYDRYVAICRPLYYHTIMSRRLCGLMTLVSWGFGFIEMVPTVVFVSQFTCYISKEIDHYFC
ncbi:hypothetical protein GDO81_003219 [Engystomops pustulosus]|uniref:G-protein coupled receptors family 1 profile domain-containing protein n=1 Tax=Engystomops pustulosus TaxID=76066 RepID=A0AAV7A264_ENGPU|nr:hypothetical protein GDO81_003219 [Engystomops pustulosus]